MTRERAALVETLRAAGPHAATLDPPWRTEDLLAHLYLRERSPRYVVTGVLVPKWSDRAQRQSDALVASTAFDALLDRFAAGPPPWSAFGWPVLGDAMNSVEYAVHHEDVRRAVAGWQPRAVPLDLQRAVWRGLRTMARTARAGAGAEVELHWVGSEEAPIIGKRASRTVSGDPIELAMFLTGRTEVAQVDLG